LRRVGLEALAADLRFATNARRVTNYEALRALARRCAHAVDQWLSALDAAGVPRSRPQRPRSAGRPAGGGARPASEIDHPALRRGRFVGSPIRERRRPQLDASAAAARAHTPGAGEAAGLGAAEIEALVREGVV
jgi:crotonobetainyl-CoA:carnitine CoA-transferase CaiB-like acyl-CoA transferase